MASILPDSILEGNEIHSTIRGFFEKIGIAKIMRQSNFEKTKGIPCYKILIFIFTLVFTGKNLYRTMSLNPDTMPFSKDSVYRFLNNSRFNWKKLLFLVAAKIIHEDIVPLTNEKRVNVLIIDDSIYSRNRSKAVELLSRFKDHVGNRFVKGFRMLTLGWSDGNSFIPLSFTLLAAKEEKQLCKMNPNIDKRTNGYKRRKEAVQKSTDALILMLKQVEAYNIPAQYVLFDSWFCFNSVIRKVKECGLDTICMLKNSKANRYYYREEKLDLNQLYQKVNKAEDEAGVIASVVVKIGPDQDDNPVMAKIVFVRDRNGKKDWLALLSTDINLSAKEIIRIYGKRWDIEVFFKTTKSFLRLAKEFQGQSFDSMVAHTSIVFMRYIMLSMEQRNSIDMRSLGDLFYTCCEEIQDISLMVSLQRILSLLKHFMHQLPFASEQMINDLMRQFFDALPSYFKARLSISWCES
jgi:hypothetical protein